MATTLLVIGGAGFIGSALVREAVLRGYATTVISLNMPTAALRIDGVEYISLDILDQFKISSFLSSRYFTHVVNLSGYINHSSYRDGGAQIIQAHFSALEHIVRCLNWDALKCFLQIGSSDEYGNANAPQIESMRECPISPYSFGKVASTHFLQMLNRTEGFPSVLCRLFLVYGPGQKLNRFLPHVINACLHDETFPVSAGRQIRDFCYVTDVVDAILIALNEDKALGQLFNVASGIPRTIREVIESVTNMVGGGNPEFDKIAYRKGENMSLYADIQKAKELLGWSPKTNLEAGLQSTLDFYSGNN